jgi:serine/threonine-protein kinase
MAGAQRPIGEPDGESDSEESPGGVGGSGGSGGFEAADPAATGWGTAFGSGYLLQREIGVGGMGTVWRGWALGGQRTVAVKILHPHLSGDQGVVGRFLREGDVLKRLDHPHLVKVHDLVVEGGRLGLVMDLVEGGDLHARRKRHGTLPPAEAARIGAQAAAALAAAHALGVAHLDLKPANILISAAPRPEVDAVAGSTGSTESTEEPAAELIDVRLTDFGIARLVDTPDQATTTTTYGTPDYMAPETALTGVSGPASDLYALGITLYEILVGRTPHGGGQALAVLARHIERGPRRLPGIPDQLWDVIVACTAREPEDRPEAAAVAESLAAAAPALAGLPAIDPVPRAADYEVTSEPRAIAAESTTVAVPWLAAVAAANRLTQAVSVGVNKSREAMPGHEVGDADPAIVADTADTADTGSTGTPSEDVLAAAPLKPPPSGPFSTLAQQPVPGPRVHLPTVSRTTRRRATLIGGPLVLLAVAGVSLLASGAFASAPQPTSSADNGYTVGGPGSGSAQAGGAGGTSAASGTVTGAAKSGPKSPSASKSAAKGKSASTSSATHPGSSGSPAPGGGSTTAPTTTTVITTTTSITTSSPPTSAPPVSTNTGLICRSGGFDNFGGLSEDPCIQDDDGTLTLEGQLRGTTYASAVYVVVRVDYGGTLSAANYSGSVTPDKLDGKTYVYTVNLGKWPAGEDITCQENIVLTTDKQDFKYGSNSGDIRTTS